MKILHVLNTNRFSGAENVVCQIIDLFSSDNNFDMLYCSPQGDIENVLEDKGIEYVGMRKLTFSELRKVIKQQSPDVIHAHDMRASFIAACVCGRIPLISHIHNNAFDSRRVGLKSIAYLLAAARAKHIFWVSETSFKGYFFHKLFSRKSSVLYNVINVQKLFERLDCDINTYNYDVVFLGRLTFPKNPQRLMKVIRLIKEKLPRVKIAVIGTGELEEETHKLAREYDLLDNVSFLGFQPNPLKILHDSKVMIMTSRWEGTPMCALEAAALGVPIVSTPVDGLTKIIEHGWNGYLSDDDDTLSQHVTDILMNDGIYKSLSQNQVNKGLEINETSKYRDAIKAVYMK